MKCYNKFSGGDDDTYVSSFDTGPHDEGHGSFFNCIQVEDTIEWLANELHNRQELHLHIQPDDFLHKMASSFLSNNKMTNEYNYEILNSLK